MERIKNEKIDFTATNAPQKYPQIEFNLSKMRVMGNNGCNNFSGDIKEIDPSQLTLRAIAVTNMACHNMAISDKFNSALNNVSEYKIGNLKLTLYDKNRNELLQFKKVD